VLADKVSSLFDSRETLVLEIESIVKVARMFLKSVRLVVKELIHFGKPGSISSLAIGLRTVREMGVKSFVSVAHVLGSVNFVVFALAINHLELVLGKMVRVLAQIGTHNRSISGSHILVESTI
jgi:hypothetical protein